MNRGFYRLSLAIVLIGEAVLLLIWYNQPPPGPIVTYPPDAAAVSAKVAAMPVEALMKLSLVFAVFPAIVVLVVGWVVAGFKRPYAERAQTRSGREG